MTGMMAFTIDKMNEYNCFTIIIYRITFQTDLNKSQLLMEVKPIGLE